MIKLVQSFLALSLLTVAAATYLALPDTPIFAAGADQPGNSLNARYTGGFGKEGLDTLTLLGSTDVTTLFIQLLGDAEARTTSAIPIG